MVNVCKDGDLWIENLFSLSVRLRRLSLFHLVLS